MAETTYIIVSLHVENGGSPTGKKRRMHNPPLQNGKEICKYVIIRGSSLLCRLLERHLQKKVREKSLQVLLNQLNVRLDQNGLIPESQYGFRKERGTLEMIFTARQPQKKCQEQKCGPLYDLCRPSLTWWALGSWRSLAFYQTS